MAYYETYNVQFLDLSGVEEDEKNWILSFLQIRDSTVKGPWNKAIVQQQPQPPPPLPSEPCCNVQTPVLPQRTYSQYQPPVVIPNHVSPIPANVYPQPAYQQHLPPFPTTYVPPIQYQSPIVAPIVPVVAAPIPMVPVVNNQYPVNYSSYYPPQNNYQEVYEPQGCVVEDVAFPIAEEEENVDHELMNGDAKEADNGGKSWASLFNKGGGVVEAAVGDSGVVNKENDVQVKVVKSKGVNLVRTNRNVQEFDDPNYYRMAEILANHKVDHKITSLQPRGLINHSNYCYINSILQAMLACPPVYNLLSALSLNVNTKETRKHTQMIDSMVKFVNEFQHLPPGQRVTRRVDPKLQKKEQTVSINCDRPFEPFWIYKVLNGIRSDSFIVEGRQEDAEEFLGCLLNGLNDEMLELIKLVQEEEEIEEEVEKEEGGEDREWHEIGPKNKGRVTRRTEITKTPISDIFGGHIRSRLYRAGDQITDNIQPFFTLQLNIEKVNTVREALEALVSKNQLEGVTSSKTNQEVEAWQQVTIEELPVVLVLHLKCFDFKLDGCTKIVKALEFPVDLKIDSKLLSSKTNYQAKEKQYKLFAVVYHDGKEATKGHFITDAYHVGYASWIRYDDAAVKTVQEEQVLKPHGTRVPYLLFYRRSDTVRIK